MTDQLSPKAQGRPLLRGWDWDDQGYPRHLEYGENGYCPNSWKPGALSIEQYWQGLDERLQRFQSGETDLGFNQDPRV
jgi:hypothetical protein